MLSMNDKIINPIEEIYSQQSEILHYLTEASEVSFVVTLDDQLKKFFVLSSASYFEVAVTQMMVDFFVRKSEGKAIVSFLENKALKRQYHTLFNWEDAKNCNTFFGLFGSEFKDEITKIIQSNEDLSTGMRDFLEIGRLRNHLIHKNIATQFVDKTAAELYTKYQSATLFISFLQNHFKSH